MSVLSYISAMLSRLLVPSSIIKPISSATVLPVDKAVDDSFVAQCHPLVDKVSKEVDGYFLEHWPFEDEKARKKFVAAGFSRVTCLYFPKSIDDRMHFACRLLTVLFLIDDVLEYMSLEEGQAYNERLIPISRGEVLPDRSVPVEYILYDLWESMRAKDYELARATEEPTYVFMRSQTDRQRLQSMGLGTYFEYRERDVGKALLSSLMRFAMGLHVSPEDLAYARPIERNCSKHISVINDVYSFEKEALAAKEAHEEGGALCTSVQIMADEAEMEIGAAKRVLLAMCKEWEDCHRRLVKKAEEEKKPSPELRAYMKGLEYQMSGNELWSQTTQRYSDP